MRRLQWMVVLLAICGCGGESGQDQERVDQGEPAAPMRSLPLIFDSEVVKLFVEEDSLRVDGFYRFLRVPGRRPPAVLFYPYPVDSLLGGARTVSLEGRTPPAVFEPLDFKEFAQSRGVRWLISLDFADTLEVRTTYRQAILTDYARYIVTSTSAWDRPLRSARFEIRLPAGATPERFSFPFEPVGSGPDRYYVYEAVDFWPEQDVRVTWKP